jgi:hypothetical protein
MLMPFALSLSKGILRGSTSAFSPELAEGSPRTGKSLSFLKFNIVELSDFSDWCKVKEN